MRSTRDPQARDRDLQRGVRVLGKDGAPDAIEQRRRADGPVGRQQQDRERCALLRRRERPGLTVDCDRHVPKDMVSLRTLPHASFFPGLSLHS